MNSQYLVNSVIRNAAKEELAKEAKYVHGAILKQEIIADTIDIKFGNITLGLKRGDAFKCLEHFNSK